MDLIKKHIQEGLNSTEELDKLRKLNHSLDDKTLAKMMFESFENTTESEGEAFSEDTLRIYSRIKNEKKPAKFSFIKIALKYAAMLLIPILLLTTIHFYRQVRVIEDGNIDVVTHQGERVRVLLPDGTHVFLNASSRLRYNPLDFNKNKRNLFLEGEAFFEVAKDKDHPFILSMTTMKLTVLGTKFSIVSRFEKKNIEVYLNEGSVLLNSKISNDRQIIKPTEKAFFNTKTGKFTVKKVIANKRYPDWTQGNMVFRRIPLKKVLNSLSENYNVDISFDENKMSSLLNDLFVGTLPNNDLDAAMKVLEEVYPIHYSQDRHNILIEKNK